MTPTCAWIYSSPFFCFLIWTWFTAVKISFPSREPFVRLLKSFVTIFTPVNIFPPSRDFFGHLTLDFFIHYIWPWMLRLSRFFPISASTNPLFVNYVTTTKCENSSKNFAAKINFAANWYFFCSRKQIFAVKINFVNIFASKYIFHC